MKNMNISFSDTSGLLVLLQATLTWLEWRNTRQNANDDLQKNLYLVEPVLFHKSWFDVVVIKKLREDNKFLGKKLIREVYCGAHDPSAMCPYRIGNMFYTDCIQVLPISSFWDSFNKNLKKKNFPQFRTC